MIVDYTPFLHVAEGGRIWWSTADAIKLGAGYLPIRDDECNLVPILRAPNNRVLVNERTLIGALSDTRLALVRPEIIERDDGRFVEARDFLRWLREYSSRLSAFQFPDDLAQAVMKAADACTPKRNGNQTEALEIGSPEWRRQTGRNAVNVRHDRPGGSRAKQNAMRDKWKTGKYKTRDECAEKEGPKLGMSFAAARKALRNVPKK